MLEALGNDSWLLHSELVAHFNCRVTGTTVIRAPSGLIGTAFTSLVLQPGANNLGVLFKHSNGELASTIAKPICCCVMLS